MAGAQCCATSIFVHSNQPSLSSCSSTDVGYNGIPGLGLINNILNRYFHVYFPRAISVAAALRAHIPPVSERLIYTTHGWLAHLYVHCPPNFTLSGIMLQCPTAAEVSAFTNAVKMGDIVWHAGAFNTGAPNVHL